jgi:hypothetical protein
MPIRSEIRPAPGELARALGLAPAAVAAHVDQQLGRGALEIARQMRLDAPKGQSTLVNSITTTHEALLRWRVGPRVEHAWYVEYGRRPGARMPPVSAVEDWVMTKLQIPPGRDRRRAAFLVARAIARRGIPARPFVGPIARDPRWQQRIEELTAIGIENGIRAAGLR